MARFERRSFGGGRRFGGSRFGGESRFDVPKPVKVGEEYDVEINEVGSKGDGIARVKNFVVFVNGVKQGDKVKIKITDVRNRFAIGEKVGETAVSEAPVEAEVSEEESEPVETEKAPEEVEEEVSEEVGEESGEE